MDLLYSLHPEGTVRTPKESWAEQGPCSISVNSSLWLGTTSWQRVVSLPQKPAFLKLNSQIQKESSLIDFKGLSNTSLL